MMKKFANIYLLFAILVALAMLTSCSGTRSNIKDEYFANEVPLKFVDSIIKHTNSIEVKPEVIVQVKSWLADFSLEKDEATYNFLCLSLAELYNVSEQMDSSIYYVEKALPYYESNIKGNVGERQTKALFLCYFVYGESLLKQGENISKANYYLSKAAEYSFQPEVDSVIDKQYQITALQYAVTTNRFCKQYEQALRYGKSALQLIAPLRSETYSVHTFRIISEIANCYSETGRFDSSLYYINRLEQQAQKVNQEEALHDLLSVKAAYYYFAEQYDSSLKYSLLSTEAIGQDDLSALATYSNNLGLCVRLKKKEEAKKWYDLAEEKYKSFEIVDASDKIAYWENKVAYDFLYGDKTIAERDYWELAKLKEEEYSRERLKMFAAIESEYNLAAKEKKIAALNTQNEIAQDRQKSLTLILLLTALLTAAVIVAAVLLIRHRKLKQEREQSRLQQQLLRTQIEPHFIFNTLSALQSFVRFDEKEKTLKYLNQFSRLLRSSLELSRERTVPLADEIETLENYLSLQKMRYDDAFSYNINCEEDIHGINVPPMLIQPFVENAILHGIDPNDNKGIITVDFVIKTDTIEVTIIDNGKGIQPSNKEAKHKSLATTISKERLAIIAKENKVDVGITIRNGVEKGTIIEIILPIEKETA